MCGWKGNYHYNTPRKHAESVHHGQPKIVYVNGRKPRKLETRRRPSMKWGTEGVDEATLKNRQAQHKFYEKQQIRIGGISRSKHGGDCGLVKGSD